MMKFAHALSSLSVVLVFATAGLFAQTLKADYQFQGNLNSSVAGAPALTNLTGSGGANSFAVDTIDGYTRQTLRFPFNSGVALDLNTGLIPINTYTIVALFRFDEVSGFRRLAGGDPTDDGGAYIQDGRLEFETTANTPFRQNHYVQVVVVRETNGTVRAYRDGGFRVNATDSFGDFIISSGILRFFQDDTNAPTEASAGNLARLRVYDGPMSTTQVRALDRVAGATGGLQPILFFSARDGNNEIYSMNADGSYQRRLTNNELSDANAQWSPNGQKIVYHRTEAAAGSRQQIWIMNPDGSGQTRLTNTTTRDYLPSWRPDGQKILFSRCDATNVCDLYTMNPDGTGQTVFPLLTTANDEDTASYSPDGTKVTFVCSTGGSSFTNQNICTANADGSNRQQITNTVSPVLNYGPTFSPNSAKIAFVRQATTSVFSADIFAVNADGSSPIQLTNDNFADLTPVWSPDGQRIATSSQREEAAFTEIYTMNASNGGSIQRLTTNSIGDTISNWRGQTRTPFDYDADGRADLSVLRAATTPAELSYWYLLTGRDGYFREEWGIQGDVLAPADYDGDGRTDLGVFRPSTGTWYSFNISSLSIRQLQWGEPGDIPVPADHDGDGKADYVLYRPSNGTWYKRLTTSTGTYATTFAVLPFGTAEDKPQAGDFDGDGLADLAVFRPSNGTWYFRNSAAGFSSQIWGAADDMPVPADYDGDGRSDVAVWRPSAGQWLIVQSSNNFIVVRTWGTTGDKPVPADYSGDGKTDIAVFRPSTATWHILSSSSGSATQQFGQNGDLPTPNAFVR